MRDLANLFVPLLIVFGASCAVAFGIGLALRRWRRPWVPPANAKMRVRTADAIYRCRFVGEGTDGWAFSAPLQRDNYVPLNVGQTVSCEVTTDLGVVVFEARVKGRRTDPPAIVIVPPRDVRNLNRRNDERRPVDGKNEIMVDGVPGSLLDLSRGGAKLRMRRAPVRGARVGFTLPGGESIPADVLESEPSLGGAIVRLRFLADIDEAS